jgi:hypothetical protein
MPEVIEVDYITTTDQTLATIPNHAFGRKGSVPYFGETPLNFSSEAQVSRFLTSTGVAYAGRLLGSCPLTAEQMVDGYNLYIKMDVLVYTATPTPNEFALMLCLDGAIDAGDPALGLLFFCASAANEQFSIYALIQLEEIGGFMSLSSLPGNNAFLRLAPPSTIQFLRAEPDVYNQLVASPSDLPGVANNLNLYAIDMGAISGHSITASGIVQVSGANNLLE